LETGATFTVPRPWGWTYSVINHPGILGIWLLPTSPRKNMPKCPRLYETEWKDKKMILPCRESNGRDRDQ
jgi:hypothetical protein